MRGQVTLEALVVMLALVAAMGLWISAGTGVMGSVKEELGNATLRHAEIRLSALCDSAKAMGKGNLLSARVFVAHDSIIHGTVLHEGWNNVSAKWDGYCLLASTASSQ